MLILVGTFVMGVMTGIESWLCLPSTAFSIASEKKKKPPVESHL